MLAMAIAADKRPSNIEYQQRSIGKNGLGPLGPYLWAALWAGVPYRAVIVNGRWM